jgi:hypothetical protein
MPDRARLSRSCRQLWLLRCELANDRFLAERQRKEAQAAREEEERVIAQAWGLVARSRNQRTTG